MNRFVIPADYVRTLQIMHIAMGIGLIPFLFIILFLMSNDAPSDDEYQLIMLLTQVHIVLFFVGFFASGFLQSKLMAPANENLSTADKESFDLAWTNWLNAYKSAHIVTLAAREVPAFMGGVVIMLAALNGVLAANSYFWVNAFSAALFILYLFLTFPSEDKIRMAAKF